MGNRKENCIGLNITCSILVEEEIYGPAIIYLFCES